MLEIPVLERRQCDGCGYVTLYSWEKMPNGQGEDSANCCHCGHEVSDEPMECDRGSE